MLAGPAGQSERRPSQAVGGPLGLRLRHLAAEAYTAREGRWRCCSHGLKDRLDLCRYLVRQAIEELDRGSRARRVVVLVALEEVDQPRLRHGHHGGAGPPQTPPASPPPPPFKGKLFSRKGGR